MFITKNDSYIINNDNLPCGELVNCLAVQIYSNIVRQKKGRSNEQPFNKTKYSILRLPFAWNYLYHC
jgi:hypothetical protein